MKPRTLDLEVDVNWKSLSRGLLDGRQLLWRLGMGEVQPFGLDFGGTPIFFNSPLYQTPHDYEAEARPLRARAAAETLIIQFVKCLVEEGQA